MKLEDMLVPFFVFLIGAFALGGAVFQWEFYWRHRKARFLEGLAGRTGARIIYGAIGLGLIIVSLASARGC